MTKICALFLIVLITSFCSAAFCQETFSKQIKFETSEYQGKTVVASNGDMLATLGTDSGVYITRIGKKGFIKWEKLYGGRVYPAAVVCATSDNGFAFFGGVFSTLANAYRISLVKCDSLGNIEWSRSLDPGYATNYVYAGQLITNANEEYIVTYTLNGNSHSDEGEQIRLVKFDKSGNLIFQTGFKNLFISGWYQGISLHTVSELHNGDYLIGFDYAEAEVGINNGYFILTDSNGNLKFYKKFSPHHKYFEDDDKQLDVFSSNGRYYVLGYYYQWNDGATEFYYIAEYDGHGTTFRGTFIPYNAFALQKFLRENNIHVRQLDKYVFEENSMSFLQLLRYDPNKPAYYTFNKYDSAGRVCPDYNMPVYEYDTSSFTITLEKNLDGAIKATDSIVITNDGISKTTSRHIRTICAGGMPTVTQTSTTNEIISSKNIFITVTPNPAIDVVTLNLPAIKKVPVQLELFNSTGKLLRSFNVYSNKVSFNISAYPKGLYVVRVKDANKIQTVKFIKQ